MSAAASQMMTPRRLRAIVLVALVVALELYGRFMADPSLFVPPSRILRALFTDILGDPKIVAALGLCVLEIAVAYVLSVVVGVAIGLAIGATPFSRRALLPVILTLYVIPQVSFLPLFILGFGLGPAGKIAFGFSHAVFPIIINVVAGMRNVRPLYLDAARAMGAGRANLVRHVIAPHMAPALFNGLRLAMTLNLLGVILAELYVSTAGVGFYARLFAEDFNPGPLFALIGAMAIIAIVFNEIVRLAEHRLTPGKRRVAGPRHSTEPT